MRRAAWSILAAGLLAAAPARAGSGFNIQITNQTPMAIFVQPYGDGANCMQYMDRVENQTIQSGQYLKAYLETVNSGSCWFQSSTFTLAVTEPGQPYNSVRSVLITKTAGDECNLPAQVGQYFSVSATYECNPATDPNGNPMNSYVIGLQPPPR